ncbi:hypothetical protein GCM10010191_49920 [Actinomadura vinacea]|uniref:Protein kinase domain-containing protein n=1 Tax=Actinomadura vinacea TaxID=115336 RepID=A0ABP5WLU0_9ACTN
MDALSAVLTEQEPCPARSGELAPVLANLLVKDPSARIGAAAAREALRRRVPIALWPGGGDERPPRPRLLTTPPEPCTLLSARQAASLVPGAKGRPFTPATLEIRLPQVYDTADEASRKMTAVFTEEAQWQPAAGTQDWDFAFPGLPRKAKAAKRPPRIRSGIGDQAFLSTMRGVGVAFDRHNVGVREGNAVVYSITRLGEARRPMAPGGRGRSSPEPWPGLRDAGECTGGRGAGRALPAGQRRHGHGLAGARRGARRDVAVKELTLPREAGEARRERVVQRALHEARAAARLRHPGIVTVHDVIYADGRPWIVMELLSGRSLDAVLQDDGPLEPRRAAALAAEVLDALGTAHEQGVLHRDVRPADIFLRDDDRAVLTDFGIATLAGDASLTRPGALIGSPAYMAPERVRGEPGGPPSDLWSLAATLYALVEGHPPFDRPTPSAPPPSEQ